MVPKRKLSRPHPQGRNSKVSPKPHEVEGIGQNYPNTQIELFT
jgi:hypothetical protein